VSQSKPQLWTKDFIIVSAVNFFVTFIFYLLLVTISEYAVNEYHASTAEAGLVSGIFIIGALVGRLVTGRAIDSIGRKRTLIIGMSLTALALLLYFVHFGLGFLLFTRFLHGLTAGMATTATGTIVAQIIPNTRKGEGIGYFSMSST
jgi:MFS family permease